MDRPRIDIEAEEGIPIEKTDQPVKKFCNLGKWNASETPRSKRMVRGGGSKCGVENE